MSEIYGAAEIEVRLVVFFDRSHRKAVATLLIKELKHLPRIGEKIFLSSIGSSDTLWRVTDVTHFVLTERVSTRHSLIEFWKREYGVTAEVPVSTGADELSVTRLGQIQIDVEAVV
jgi:hypothetical protein